MRFDWYGASFLQSAGEVAAMLGTTFDLVHFVTVKGAHGYSSGMAVERGGETLARAWYGGNRGTVHAEASGLHAETLARGAREAFPAHRVTRADVCEDFQGERAWAVLLGACQGVRKRHGLQSDLQGDWEQGERGRTYYLGARASAVRLRLYEKGKQLHAQGYVSAPREWVRMELQVRPKGPAKGAAASLLPAAFWGVTGWARELADFMGASDLEPFPAGSVWRGDDKERARAAMLRQYGRVLRELADDLGGWPAVGPWVAGRLEEPDRDREQGAEWDAALHSAGERRWAC